MLLAAACGGDDSTAADVEGIETNGGGITVKPPDVLAGETEVIDGQDTAQVELPHTGDTAEPVEAIDPERALPEASFTWFDGTEGELSQLIGTPTVLNFWASTCAACIAEMPEFEEVFQALEGQVAFVGMNTSDRREAADRLAAQTGVTYPLASDPQGNVFRAFRGFVMPTTVLIDERGQIAFSWSGVLTESELRILIDEHIAPGTNQDA